MSRDMRDISPETYVLNPDTPQLHSPSPPAAPVTVGADSCRARFGYWIERVRAGEDVVVTRRGVPVVTLAAVVPATAPPLAAVAPSVPRPDNEATPQLFPPAALVRTA